jgi:hypothetical protein
MSSHSKIMSRYELVETIVEDSTPIDFDDLIARGILKRWSKTTYYLLKPTELPAAVGRQARTITSGRPPYITVRSSPKAYAQMLARVKRWPDGEALIAAACTPLAGRQRGR